MEDQITTWIAAGVSFVTGWVLDNGIPRKIAKFLVSLIVKKGLKWRLGSLLARWLLQRSAGLLQAKSTRSESGLTELNKPKPRWRSRWASWRKK